MTAPAPATPSDRAEALAFVADQQADPQTAIGYVGTLDEGLEDDLDGLDQPWLETMRVCRDADGRITGAACVEWDPEVDLAWVYGPWCTPATWGTDAEPLLQAVVAQAPVARHELFGPAENTRLAALAERLGWRAGPPSLTYAGERAALAATSPDVRPAAPSDLDVVSALHSAAFPSTYATARQLLAAEGEYTTLVAEQEGRVVGYVAGQVDGDDCYLDFVAVSPQARRGGVGRALVGALADAVPGERVRLTVDDDGAERFYLALGMDRVATMQGYRSPARG